MATFQRENCLAKTHTPAIFFSATEKQPASHVEPARNIVPTTLALFVVVLRVSETPRQKPLFRPVLPLQGDNKRAQTPIECVLIYCIGWLGLISCRILDPEYAPKRAPEPRVE
jgi:hypothetical protein